MNMGLRILIMFSFMPQVALSQHSIYDTMKVNPNSIIFYSITQAEYDSIKMEGIDEVLSDFYWYSGKIIKKYEEDERFIKVMLTTHRNYLIKTNKEEINFGRLEKDHIVGLIMVKDEGYEVIIGVDTDIGFDSSIRSFFGY